MIERMGGESLKVKKGAETRLGRRLESRFGIQGFLDPNK